VLETIGYDAATAASFAPWDVADASVGRVARVDRGVLTVLTEAGPHRVTLGGALLGVVAQDPVAAPCAGDWVVLRAWPDKRETVECVLPRRTVLQAYADPAHAPVLAANVDLVAVVVDRETAGPAPAELRRLLDLATSGGAAPHVLVTGTRPTGADARVAEVRAVAGRAVQILAVDLDGGPGRARLRELIGGSRTLALVAATGRLTAPVARALVGADVLGGGRTRRGLAPLPGGGAVLDLRHPTAPSLGGWTTREGSR
jgi:ribosome biogenesis GTPase